MTASPNAPPPAAAAPTSAPTSAPTQSAAREYDIRGKITEISADRRSVTLDHEEIPGFMAAMKMPYAVSDPNTLKDLKVGDLVQGRLQARGTDYTILSLTKR